MDSFLQYIENHASGAHWYLFIGTLLAGMNIPISIDFLMISGAILAATFIPEHLPHLYLALLFGCLFSAWIAYWIGRTLGPKIQHWPLFSKLLSPQKVENMKNFYEKRGFLSFLIGRFIPFGVRNCLFMTSGMSRLSFKKFILYDAIACTVWTTTCFALYYALGKNIELMYSKVKMINLLILLAFGVTVIGVIWYKKKKNA